MAKPTLLILAAGMGSRYGGLKQVDRLGPNGETIPDYSIYDALRAGFEKVVVVIRKDIEADFREFFDVFSKHIEVEYVFQELDNIPEGYTVPAERAKPWGTGHAIMMAENVVNEPFAVINADDFYGFEAYDIIGKHLAKLDNGSTDYCMPGYVLKNTLSDFGSVSRGICSVDEDNQLVSIVERTKIQKKEGKVFFINEEGKETEISDEAIASMNFFGFTPSLFAFLRREFKKFLDANVDKPKAEFYIPSVVHTLLENKEASMKVYKTNSEWFGITYREDRANVVNRLQQLANENKYPEKLWG